MDISEAESILGKFLTGSPLEYLMRITLDGNPTFGLSTNSSKEIYIQRHCLLHCLNYRRNGSVIGWKKDVTWQLLLGSGLHTDLYLLAHQYSNRLCSKIKSRSQNSLTGSPTE